MRLEVDRNMLNPSFSYYKFDELLANAVQRIPLPSIIKHEIPQINTLAEVRKATQLFHFNHFFKGNEDDSVYFISSDNILSKFKDDGSIEEILQYESATTSLADFAAFPRVFPLGTYSFNSFIISSSNNEIFYLNTCKQLTRIIVPFFDSSYCSALEVLDVFPRSLDSPFILYFISVHRQSIQEHSFVFIITFSSLEMDNKNELKVLKRLISEHFPVSAKFLDNNTAVVMSKQSKLSENLQDDFLSGIKRSQAEEPLPTLPEDGAQNEQQFNIVADTEENYSNMDSDVIFNLISLLEECNQEPIYFVAPFLGHVQSSSPSLVVTAFDVDAVVHNLLSQKHTMTFDAIAFILSSKVERNLMLFTEDFCAITEKKKRIYLYSKSNSDFGRQSILNISSDEDILGISSLLNNSLLIILTCKEIHVYKINKE